MRRALGFRVAFLAVLALGSGWGAVEAGCPGSQLLNATYSYLASNPNWGGAGGDRQCVPFGYGCYATQSGPPVSPRMTGVYWALGTGNPVIGLGNDSGRFAGGFGPGTFWPKQVSAEMDYYSGTPFPQGTYHYPAWVSLRLGPPSVVGPPVTWSAPDADGCGPANPPALVCTCMMLTDEWDGVGYFATLSARSDELGNTLLDPFQTIRLAPIPKPVILGVSRVLDSNPGSAVRVLVRPSTIVFGASEGVYQKGDCGTCLAAYRILGARVPRNTLPPPGTQFVDLPRGDGTPQTDTPLGEAVDVRVECDLLVDEDLYLALELVGEGTTPFRTGVLSPVSTRISCGQTLAEPEPDRGHDARGGRGRRQR